MKRIASHMSTAGCRTRPASARDGVTRSAAPDSSPVPNFTIKSDKVAEGGEPTFDVNKSVAAGHVIT